MKRILLAILLLPIFCKAQTLFDLSGIQAPVTSIVGKYNAITIPFTNVPTQDQTNFPVLITGTYAYLATVANSGFVQNANGFDITFALDSFANTPLNWDVESYNATTGAITVWVKIPTLSHTVNTVIYIKYGNPATTTYQGNRSSTWDANYLAVWHYNDILTSAGQTIHDATSNGLNATSVGTWASGQTATAICGPGLSFLNANGDCANFSQVTFGTNYTVESWYKTSTLDQTTTPLGAPLLSGTTGNDINFFGANCHLFIGGGSGHDIVATTSTVPSNTWTHVVFTVAGTSAIAYFNGSQNNTTTSGASNNFQYMGRQGSTVSSNYFVDEMRLSSIARSASWIAIEYANMNSPSTFYTIGAQQ